MIGSLIIGLSDDEETVQQECITSLINLRECIQTHYEELSHVIRPLMQLIRYQNELHINDIMF